MTCDIACRTQVGGSLPTSAKRLKSGGRGDRANVSWYDYRV